MNNNIAFFDFDGTITNKDSLIDFIRFAVGDCRFWSGMIFLSPMLFLYKFKIIPNYKAKQWMLSHYFKGMSISDFKSFATSYANERIDKIVRPAALEKINFHKQNGDKVVVVSASAECWLRLWCERNELELIATRLKFENERFSGLFDGKNCYGAEKLNRIREKYDLSGLHYIYAYGDSAGDAQMLKIANEKFYKPFR